jgi:transcriptional regulator with XRE-family HTH domain
MIGYVSALFGLKNLTELKMAKCNHCGTGEVVRITLPEYVDDLMGAPFQVAVEHAVVQERCKKCGAVLGNDIPDLRGLIAAVAMTRALDPEKLSGDEIRFLRKAVGWKAKDVAEILQVTPEHVSRCEAGKSPLSEGLEKYLRHYACEKIKAQFVLAIELRLDAIPRMKLRPALGLVQASDDPGKRIVRVRKYRFIRVPVPVQQRSEPEPGWELKHRKRA